MEYGQTRKLYIKFFNYPDTAYWPLYANKDHLSAAWNSLMWIQLSDLFDLQQSLLERYTDAPPDDGTLDQVITQEIREYKSSNLRHPHPDFPIPQFPPKATKDCQSDEIMARKRSLEPIKELSDTSRNSVSVKNPIKVESVSQAPTSPRNIMPLSFRSRN